MTGQRHSLSYYVMTTKCTSKHDPVTYQQRMTNNIVLILNFKFKNTYAQAC